MVKEKIAKRTAMMRENTWRFFFFRKVLLAYRRCLINIFKGELELHNLALTCKYFGFHQACADPEGEQGVRTPPPLKNHKNIGFLRNTGPDPLKNRKATKPAFKVGTSSARQRNAVSLNLNGVSLARF